MKRRSFLETLGAGLATAAVPGASWSQSIKPMNVVLIVADDHGYADMSCTGLAEDVHTPHLDRLAGEGVRFTQAYATSPICSPSRAGLLTGCYHQRYGISWYGGPGLHDPNYKTLAEVLNARGYQTGYVGKFHYGGGVHHPGHRSFPLNHGFDTFMGCAGGRKHYLIHNEEAEAAFLESKQEHNRSGQSLQKGPMWVQDQLQDMEGFSTELFGDEACTFIRKNRDQSFFLQLSFTAVHNFTHQLPDDYLEANDLEGYRDWDPAVEEYYGWYQEGRLPNNPEGRAHYLGQLHYLDREVGRVMQCLREAGVEENTLVVYVGDNGGSTPIYANNSPLRGSKYTLYEGGIRVPLIVWKPGQIEGGRVMHNVVSAMDLFPTICSLLDEPVPATVDGMNLLPLLDGREPLRHHETLFWDTGHEIAVRSGDWKYHHVYRNRHADYEMVELEPGESLHHLGEDVGEQENRLGDFPHKANELKSLFQQWKSIVS